MEEVGDNLQEDEEGKWLMGAKIRKRGEKGASKEKLKYRRMSDSGWIEYVQETEASKGNVVKLGVDSEHRNTWVQAVVVVVSDASRGLHWAMDVLKEHFGVRGQIIIKPLAVGKGLLFVENERARRRIIDMGWVVEMGIQISCAPWRSEVNTLKNISSSKKKNGFRFLAFHSTY